MTPTKPASVPLPPVTWTREIDLCESGAHPDETAKYRALERGHEALKPARVPS
jgi:hypothetical protein